MGTAGQDGTGGQPRQECVVLPKSPRDLAGQGQGQGAKGQGRGMAVSSPTPSGGGKAVTSPALPGPRPGAPRLGFVRDGLLLAGSQWSCVAEALSPHAETRQVDREVRSRCSLGLRSYRQVQVRRSPSCHPGPLQAGDVFLETSACLQRFPCLASPHRGPSVCGAAAVTCVNNHPGKVDCSSQPPWEVGRRLRVPGEETEAQRGEVTPPKTHS